MEKTQKLTLPTGEHIYIRSNDIIYATPHEAKGMTKIGLSSGEHWVVKEPAYDIMAFTNG